MLENLLFLAQTTTTTSSDGGGAAIALVQLCCFGILLVIMFASFWVLFTKAGRPGYLGIIPIVNIYYLLEIVGRPGWWVVLFFIPFVNFVVSIILYIDIAKAYGKNEAWGCGMVIFPYIMFPLLAYTGEYKGPVA